MTFKQEDKQVQKTVIASLLLVGGMIFSLLIQL